MKKQVAKSDSIAGYFSKLWKLYFYPKEFFKSVEKEEDYFPILKIFIFFYLLSFIVSISVAFFFISNDFGIYDFIFAFITAIIFSFLYPFAISGIFHIGTKIFKTKKEFFKTFKPVTYALIVGAVYTILTSILIIFFPIDNSILYSAQQTQDMEILKQTYIEYFSQPGAIIDVVLTAVALIHIFALSIFGISKFHKITKSKAAAAIVISSLLFFVAITLISMVYYLANAS